MPELLVAPHPCPICGTEHRRPWPACASEACRKEWRKRRHTFTNRELYANRVARGLCGRCGGKIPRNARSKSTGQPLIGRCPACAREDREGKAVDRSAERAQKLADEAALKAVEREIERRRVERDRAAAGLPPSKAIKPKLPKTVRGVMEL